MDIDLSCEQRHRPFEQLGSGSYTHLRVISPVCVYLRLEEETFVIHTRICVYELITSSCMNNKQAPNKQILFRNL